MEGDRMENGPENGLERTAHPWLTPQWTMATGNMSGWTLNRRYYSWAVITAWLSRRYWHVVDTGCMAWQ